MNLFHDRELMVRWGRNCRIFHQLGEVPSVYTHGSGLTTAQPYVKVCSRKCRSPCIGTIYIFEYQRQILYYSNKETLCSIIYTVIYHIVVSHKIGLSSTNLTAIITLIKLVLV